MYQSLHAVLAPLREKQVTGTLSLEHRDGQKITFSILKGDVISCQNGNTSGLGAAKLAATWLDFDCDFYEGVISEEEDADQFNENYFNMLASIENRVQEYSQVIPHSELRFKVLRPSFEGEIEFKGYELKVAILLDGTRTVDQVASESGISDFLVLSSIYKFAHLKMIKMMEN